ncbi:hypothetical protein [Gymnodinialimonas sp.]
MTFRVVPAPASLSDMDMLEHRLSAALGRPPIGEVGGHEIELSGADAFVFLYGPNAKAIFEAVKLVILETDWINEASVSAILGDPKDMASDIVEFSLERDVEWPGA